MNRTVTFLGAAGALALVALLLGMPRAGAHGGNAPPSPTPPPPAPSQDGSLQLAARLSHPVVPTGSSDVFVTVDLQAKEVPGAPRAPVNLALVIDRSGSMAGEKLRHARQAARRLVQQLTPSDRLAIVHYGSDVGAFHSAHVTPDTRVRMLGFIDSLHDDGGTNIGAGLEEAHRQLMPSAREFRTSRVILLSDGQPTEGVVDEEGLRGVVRRLRAAGLSLSAIGVGDDFNEDLMQSLAEHGAGAYAYLQDAAQLATIFQKDLQRASTVVAQRAELRLALPQGVQLGEVLGYDVRSEGRVVHVTLPDFSAGQLERVVARLTVSGGAPGRSFDVSNVAVAYTDVLRDRPALSEAQLTATVTDRPEEVLARQDKEATVHAVRALAARNTRLAADALAEGRPEEARSHLLGNVGILEKAEQVTGRAALEADFAEQEQLRLTSEAAAAAPEARSGAAKEMKVRAKKGFGQLGSTY